MSIDRRIYSFQYRLISCYVLLLISLAVYAQSGKERFVGRVVDTETNQPVPFATVRLLALPDSILLVGGATDIQGKFQLAVTIPKSKSILLHISYIGYTSVYRTISVSANNKTPTLGNISLSPESISLNETVVVGQAPMAVTEGDTTVFNASAYRTPEGSMLEELVKQLPGGEIDEDGKLLIHGKEVKKILVDGKEFFSDDPKAALKNLPVEMIEKLKAYERQSDLARLTGIDDGEEEMILDLSVKKNMKRGWMENKMNIQIFGKSKCFDTKKAERYFKERGIRFQSINLSEKGMSKGEFNRVKQAVGGLESMIDKDCKDKDLLALIQYIAAEDRDGKVLENQNVLKTPIVRNGAKATVGYQPDVWKTWE